MPRKRKNNSLTWPVGVGDGDSSTESMEDNLFVEYTTSKNKVKMILSIEEIRSGVVIKDNCFENNDKRSFNLNTNGFYLLKFHFGRKKYIRWIVVAPGDEPIRIHCKWKKRKARIVIEQSAYSSRVVRRLTSKNPYLKLLQFQERVRRALGLVCLVFLGPSLFVEVLFLVLIIVLDVLRGLS